MKEIEKILEVIEESIQTATYIPVETEKVELKPTPPNLKGASSLLQSICAFLNTNGGIVIVGIRDNNNVAKKNYEVTGYKEDFENVIKEFGSCFTDFNQNLINISQYIVHHEVRSFMNNRICAIYVDVLPEDLKFAFIENKAYKRVLTGDHLINQNTIESHEEFKEEIKNALELKVVREATIDDIDIDKINDYIYLLNREVKIETNKQSIEDAKSFLTRKKFIINNEPTILGMLVCGKHVKDFLGWRAQVDAFVDTPYEVAQDKKSLVDNVIPLMERSLSYILKNIQVGVTIEKSGTAKPEYPEQLLRETINNAIAHRDYSVNKYVNINIKPNSFIEIRNPGSFKRQLLIELLDNEIPVRRIIPDSKPRNPRLADVLKVFDKWEGKSRGMSNLVNAALENKIDLPYYRFYSKDDLGLFIQKGKLVDESFIFFLNSFDLFTQTKLNGSSLKEDEIAVLAYLYKSEYANANYRHTILLTPDNNHLGAISRLAKSGLIYEHPKSPALYPIFMVNREFMRENYNTELKETFGNQFEILPEIYKQTLSLIYQVNHYSLNKSISATQAGRLLYYKSGLPLNDIREFDNFKRKIYGVFKNLLNRDYLVNDGGKYFINSDFKPKSSLFN